MKEEIERLLYEAQRTKFTERRTESRHPFVRPVTIYVGTEPGMTAFAKDISILGIGIVSPMEFSTGSQAVLRIHSVNGTPVFLRSEARWSDAFGKGWFNVGWKFISAASPPAQAHR
ncbi:MAG: PilZ domain-containing protein [Planctomycetaceae bacterium]|nr:PilZ domain-containing protein [Planctomycetaceae bacterium]